MKVPIKDSSQRASHHARLLGPTNPNLKLKAVIHLRRRIGHDRLPTFDDFIGCPKRTRLSNDDFAARYGASAEDIQAVSDFCLRNDLTVLGVQAHSRQIKVSGSIAQFNYAFNLDIQDHEIDDSYHGTYQFRAFANAIHVDEHLVHTILGLHGISNEVRIRPTGQQLTSVSSLGIGELAYLYQNLGNSAAGQTIGIWGFYSLPSDIQATFELYDIPLPNIKYLYLNGATPTQVANDVSGNPIEGNLDIAMAGGLGQGANIVVFYPNSADSTYLTDTLSRVIFPLSGDAACDCLSMSWIFPAGAEQGSSFASNVAGIMEPLFQDAAMQGVTMLSGTGDQGASNYIPNSAASIGYPCGSPWVLACGGTVIGNVASDGSSFQEIVWNDAPDSTNGSGGGVSAFFPVPSYQQGLPIPNAPQTGRPGRSVPDICANGSGYSSPLVYVNGTAEPVGGTSESTPIIAGMLAKVSALIGHAVGFVNPSLYAAGCGLLHNAVAFGTVDNSFTDAGGNVWSLVSSNSNGLQIAVNGVIDNTTRNVVYLMYYIPYQTIYQQNTGGNWYKTTSAVPGTFTATFDPISFLVTIRDITGGNNSGNGTTGYTAGTGWDVASGLGVMNGAPFGSFLASPAPSPSPPPSPSPGPPSPIPSPPPSPPSSPSESAQGTIVNSTSGSIVDSLGHFWTLHA